MSDEQNPYRFSGDASEEISPASEIPRRLTLRDLKGIARGRRWLGGFLGLFFSCSLNAVGALALAPASNVHAAATYLPYVYWAQGATILALIGMLSVFVVGTKMIALLHRRHATLETIGLLLPGPNVVVVELVVRDAKRTLAERNVRWGWLEDDFSEARADRSYWRPRSL